MQATTIRLPGSAAIFAVGLHWRHEGARPKRARLKALAAEQGRWGVLRTTTEGAFQVGFCAPIEGVTRPNKLTSLADSVADMHLAPWRGSFDVGDGRFWYIAAGVGHEILPDGDQVCTAAELGQAKAQHDAHANWNEVQGTLEDLERYLVGNARRATLRDLAPSLSSVVPLRNIAPKVVLIGGAVCFAAAIGGGFWYVAHKQRQAEREQADLQRQLKARAALAAPVVVPKKPTPWVNASSANAAFEACRAAWSGQALVVAGWALETWYCEVTTSGIVVKDKWMRESGNAVDAPGVLDAAGDHALGVRSLDIDWSSDTGAGADLLLLTEGRRRLWGFAQHFGLGLEIGSNESAAPKKAPGSPEDPSDHPQWQQLRLNWSLPFAPWFGFARFFDALPGLRVRSVALDLVNDAWVVEAAFYAKSAAKNEEGK